ncbi:MAG: Bug family tripartite tricarboxylate transporter substrate binding protein, partial [Bradyrhizobium sp.]
MPSLIPVCHNRLTKKRLNAMISSRSRHLSGAAIALTATLAASILSIPCTSQAEDSASGYPARTIRIVVPFPAGGTADILPRIVAEKLRERWKQPVIIENRSGAGGNIGAEFVAASPPDGYMLLASPPGPIAINETLYKTLPFRPADLEPITVLGSVPNVLAVRLGFPAQTAKDVIEYSKANPGKVSFASQGNGSTSHLTAVLFQKLTGSQMVHIPY